MYVIVSIERWGSLQEKKSGVSFFGVWGSIKSGGEIYKRSKERIVNKCEILLFAVLERKVKEN